jgi:hypothetical protein
MRGLPIHRHTNPRATAGMIAAMRYEKNEPRIARMPRMKRNCQSAASFCFVS